jgi:hypothetical protein
MDTEREIKKLKKELKLVRSMASGGVTKNYVNTQVSSSQVGSRVFVSATDPSLTEDVQENDIWVQI